MRHYDYHFVSADTMEELVEKVNDELEQGYIAVGSPIHHNFHVGKGRLHQAVVRAEVGFSKVVKEKTIVKEKDRPSSRRQDEDNVWQATWDEGDKESNVQNNKESAGELGREEKG